MDGFLDSERTRKERETRVYSIYTVTFALVQAEQGPRVQNAIV